MSDGHIDFGCSGARVEGCAGAVDDGAVGAGVACSFCGVGTGADVLGAGAASWVAGAVLAADDGICAVGAGAGALFWTGVGNVMMATASGSSRSLR